MKFRNKTILNILNRSIQIWRDYYIFYLLTTICVTFLLHSFWIQAYSVNMPFWDEWGHITARASLPNLFISYSQGIIDLPLLFDQHNEHRIFVTRVLQVLTFALFGEWNAWANMLVSGIFIGLMAGIIFYIVKAFKLAWFFIIPVILILISPMQWQNITWGFQIHFYALAFFVVLGVVYIALSKKITWIQIGIVSLLAFLDTYTLASGLSAWIVFGISLCFKAYFGQGSIVQIYYTYWKKMLVYLSLFALTIYSYFANYTSAASGATAFNPESSIIWLITALSLPLGINITHNLGILIVKFIIIWFPILYTLWYTWRRREQHFYQQAFLFLLGLSAFLFGNGMIISYGRAGFEIAIASRYTTIFIWVAIISLLSVGLLLSFHTSVWFRFTSLVWIMLVFVSLWRISVIGFESMRDDYAYRSEMHQSIVKYMSDPRTDKTLRGSIPYPEREYLVQLLANPEVVALLPKDLVIQEEASWSLEGNAWTRNGGISFIPYNIPLVWGSWSGKHSNQGIIRSSEIYNDSDILVIPVSGHFDDATGNSLTIEVVEDPSYSIRYSGSSPGSGWDKWYVNVSHLHGKHLQLVAVDASEDMWLAFGWPVKMGFRAFLISAYIVGYKYIIGLFIAFAFVFAISKTIWPKTAGNKSGLVAE